MTADIRTAAEDAMIRADAVEPLVVVEGEEAVMQLTDYGNGFVAGAVWGAARVTPTLEQVERALIGRDFVAGADAILALMEKLRDIDQA